MLKGKWGSEPRENHEGYCYFGDSLKNFRSSTSVEVEVNPSSQQKNTCTRLALSRLSSRRLRAWGLGYNPSTQEVSQQFF